MITGCAFSADARLVLSCSLDGEVHVWEAGSGQPVAVWAAGHGPVLTAAFDPVAGEPRVLTGCADGSVWVWPVDPLPAARARCPRELGEWELKAEELKASLLVRD